MTNSNGVEIILDLILPHVVDLDPVPDLDEPPLHILSTNPGSPAYVGQVNVGRNRTFHEKNCQLSKGAPVYR